MKAKTKHIKSVSLHFRTTEKVKIEAEKKAAEENRTLSNWLDKLVSDAVKRGEKKAAEENRTLSNWLDKLVSDAVKRGEK